MSLSTLPLSYCTNVHPARTLDDVLNGLRDYTGAIRDAAGQPVAAGLWLARSVVEECVTSSASQGSRPGQRVEELRRQLAELELTCYTLNAFPYGDFHEERVKDQVYVPDWSTPERADYTTDCAAILAALLPDGCDGSLSTLPLGFKGHPHDAEFEGRCIDTLLGVADALDSLHDETGRCVRLAIEPEPFCLLETTSETLAFFRKLYDRAEQAGQGDVVRRHLGVCFDVCHQAVEFEDVAESIRRLTSTGIRINKLHITCALHLATPAEAALREELAAFVEPRYLHQTLARTRQGIVVRRVDLDRDLCKAPPAAFRDAAAWRIHFHVPVHREHIGGLGTTQADLKAALAAVAALDYAPHLEVETYTWGVLPGERPKSLVEGIAAEMRAVHGWLAELR
ncbi:MAG: metabolite traffic protein EboE [Planctomyces sp.]|nr:metabolite traffic protein EboE [Planctomyces sp.]